MGSTEAKTLAEVVTPGPESETLARLAFAREQLAALGLADVAAFKVLAGEDGELMLACPSGWTIGCLYTPTVGDSYGVATIAELMLAACAHTGLAAGEAHASLAVATGAAEEGPDNDGNLVIYSSAVAPGGWVCAVPVGDRPDWLCGHPVESEPCPEHRNPDWKPE